jgi:hypothetical protein
MNIQNNNITPGQGHPNKHHHLNCWYDCYVKKPVPNSWFSLPFEQKNVYSLAGLVPTLSHSISYSPTKYNLNVDSTFTSVIKQTCPAEISNIPYTKPYVNFPELRVYPKNLSNSIFWNVTHVLCWMSVDILEDQVTSIKSRNEPSKTNAWKQVAIVHYSGLLVITFVCHKAVQISWLFPSMHVQLFWFYAQTHLWYIHWLCQGYILLLILLLRRWWYCCQYDIKLPGYGLLQLHNNPQHFIVLILTL